LAGDSLADACAVDDSGRFTTEIAGPVAGEFDAASVDSSVATASVATDSVATASVATASVATAPVDVAPVDVAPVDVAPVDAASVDAASVDAAPVDVADGAKLLAAGRISPLSASLSETVATRCEEVRNEAPGGWAVSLDESGRLRIVVSSADALATKKGQATPGAPSRLAPSRLAPSRWAPSRRAPN
jgi:hypothetical protein